MGQVVERQSGTFLWQVDGDLAAQLFPPGNNWLTAAVQGGKMELVKVGQGRRISRLAFGESLFYVKEYHGSAAGRRARREWLAARWAYDELKLPTPRPVAACWQGAAIYISAAAPGARTLTDLVYDCFEPEADEPPYPGHRPPELVRLYRTRRPQLPPGTPRPAELAALIADLLAELQKHNLQHADLHPGNLLLVADPGGRRRLQVLDVLELATGARRDQVRTHLVRLNHFFEPLATRAERLRLLVQLKKRGLDYLEQAPAIEAETWRYRHDFYRGRDRRCLRASKYFVRLHRGRFHGYAAQDFAERLPPSGQELRTALEVTETIKNSRREVSGFGTVGGLRVFIKRDARRGWRITRVPPGLRTVKRLALGTRQKHGWKLANMLLVRGIRTARPLCWTNLHYGLLGREGILVLEALDAWRSLDRGLPGCVGRVRHKLVEAVAREIRHLHEAGVSQRDLKAQNIMIRYDGRTWRVAVIDMTGVRLHSGPVPLARRVQNVMRLAFSWSGVGISGQAEGLNNTDRLRFMKIYLGSQVRQAVTIEHRRRNSEPARQRIELLRGWWRGLEFALREKAGREARRRHGRWGI